MELFPIFSSIVLAFLTLDTFFIAMSLAIFFSSLSTEVILPPILSFSNVSKSVSQLPKSVIYQATCDVDVQSSITLSLCGEGKEACPTSDKLHSKASSYPELSNVRPELALVLCRGAVTAVSTACLYAHPSWEAGLFSCLSNGHLLRILIQEVTAAAKSIYPPGRSRSRRS